MNIKQRAREMLNKQFSSHKDHETRDIGNDLVDTRWYFYELDEEEIVDFINQIIDLAIAERNKEIVEKIKGSSFWRSCEDYFTPEQRERFINLITNKNENI